MFSRRRFLQTVAVGAAAPWLPTTAADLPPILKPKRLRPGDTVGLINPASATFEPDDIALVEETMTALGLRSRRAPHLLARHGYLGGTDAERAADLHAMFADPGIAAILAVRGGWGTSRLLPLLDYDLIRRNPKLLIGYSDLTALLIGIYARTGLVTIHGPVGISTWDDAFSLDYFRRLLFEGEALTMRNPTDPDALVQTEHRIQPITPGTARGRLVGGNLTVLSAILGSPYLPDWRGHLLFLEDIGEQLYRIDRMLTHLKITGLLGQLSGFIFGQCTDCDPGRGYASLTMTELMQDHIAPLGIPAFRGAMIGHIKQKFSVPLGVEAEMDAAKGTIRLLEPAVQ